MIKALLSRAIRMLCLGGIVLGMNSAIAREDFAVSHDSYSIHAVAACSDPEGEVGNGSEPPHRIPVDPDTEVNDGQSPPVTDNFSEHGEEIIQTVAANSDPEGEVGNGMEPPRRIPTAPENQGDDSLAPPPAIESLPEQEELQPVFAKADPETEVGNGMDPPVRAIHDPQRESEEDYGPDTPPTINNFPEGEISNGSDPPK